MPRSHHLQAFTLFQLLFVILVIVGIVWGVRKWTHKEDALAAVQSSPIVVKGLYIGMTAAEIPQAVQDKLGSQWRVYKQTDPRSLEIVTDLLNPLTTKGDYGIVVTFDDDKRVNAVIFGENCSRLLFDSGGMDGTQFRKVFMEAYNIPKMEYAGEYWYYTTPENVTVKVMFAKAVVLAKTADAATVRSKFN